MMLRNIGSNWALILMTIAATYVITPFTISALGQEGYGTWTLITSMTGYISLMALGVPMACVRYLAQDIAEGDSAKEKTETEPPAKEEEPAKDAPAAGEGQN